MGCDEIDARERIVPPQGTNCGIALISKEMPEIFLTNFVVFNFFGVSVLIAGRGAALSFLVQLLEKRLVR